MTEQAIPLPRPDRLPGAALVIVGLIALFSVLSPSFRNADNLINVLTQSTVLLLIALPMTIVVMTEGLDLSVGAVLSLATVVLAVVTLSSGSIAAGVAAAIAIGITFGFANGAIVGYFRIPPFVATLSTLGVAQGGALLVSDGNIVPNLPRAIQLLYSGHVLGIPVPIIFGGIAYLSFHTLLYRTRIGVYIPALGGNREALRNAGHDDRHLLVVPYVLSGLMAGVAALLLAARTNSGHPSVAIGMEFDAVAAVALGGTEFEKGNGWLFGTALGVLSIGILRNGLNLLEIPSSMQVVCVGLLVILALYFDGRKRGEP